MSWAVPLVVGAILLYAWAYGQTMNQSILESIAAAIKQFEGWFPGSVSERNNNPGNLKFANQPGTVGQDPRGFAIFDTYEDGQNALLTLLNNRSAQHPDWTLLDLFNSYAPPSDGNNPDQYASYVEAQTGLTPGTTLGSLT